VTEAEFLADLAARGYGEAQVKSYPPHTDGPLHTHDVTVRLLVLDGVFTLAEAGGSRTFRPGEVCELAAGVRHTEQTGAEGARILLAKR